jgi:hypothetical protein
MRAAGGNGGIDGRASSPAVAVAKGQRRRRWHNGRAAKGLCVAAAVVEEGFSRQEII